MHTIVKTAYHVTHPLTGKVKKLGKLNLRNICEQTVSLNMGVFPRAPLVVQY